MQAKFLHRDAADQVFLYDPFQHVFGAGVIPDPVWPDDRHRAGGADLQAIGLGPLDPALPGNAELFQAFLEVLPGSFADITPAAFLLFGDRAQEDVPPDRFAADLVQRRCGLGKFPGRGR